MTTKDTLTLLREVEAALNVLDKSSRHQKDPEYTSERSYGNYDDCFDDGYEQSNYEAADIARNALPAIQELVRRASVAPVANGWMPIEREELAQEIACYFAGFSFSRHELKECLGLVDVLITRGLIAKPQPPQAKGRLDYGK